jgi:hypothetical protein
VDPVNVQHIPRAPQHSAQQPAIQGRNPLRTAVAIDRGLLATVPHSAISAGLKYLLGHNIRIITNINENLKK